MITPGSFQKLWGHFQDRVAATSPTTWGLVGVGTIVGGVVFGWIAFPFALQKIIESQINLNQGTDSRKTWVQLPALNFNVYLFNITNPSGVMRGEKPVVQEVGPYCYRETKEKLIFREDATSDTISYRTKTSWYSNQQDPVCQAKHLTGDESLVALNVPLLSILTLAEKDYPAPFLTLVNLALPSIFGGYRDVFLRVRARTLLFDGVPVDCSHGSVLTQPVCNVLRENAKTLKKLDTDRYHFSFFGAKNGTLEDHSYTVKRGTQNSQEVGQLVALDGRAEMPFWRGECNMLKGTDGSIFPSFRQRENGSLTAYSSEVCRVISGVYEGEYEYEGVKGFAFTATLGDTEAVPADRCFCPADDRCYKKGALDAFKCQGAPLVSSLPHFYQGSSKYVRGVVGLKPDQQKHGIFIVLEPISGTPLLARKRIQMNFDLKPVRFTPLTQSIHHSLTPLFWAEEVLEMNTQLMGVLEASLFRPIKVVDVIKWLCVITGLALVVTGMALKVRRYRRDRVHVISEATGDQGQEEKQKQALKYLEPEGTENRDPFFAGV